MDEFFGFFEGDVQGSARAALSAIEPGRACQEYERQFMLRRAKFDRADPNAEIVYALAMLKISMSSSTVGMALDMGIRETVPNTVSSYIDGCRPSKIPRFEKLNAVQSSLTWATPKIVMQMLVRLRLGFKMDKESAVGRDTEEELARSQSEPAIRVYEIFRYADNILADTAEMKIEEFFRVPRNPLNPIALPAMPPRAGMMDVEDYLSGIN